MVNERESFYKLFYEMREEIMRHKWIESEKQNKDIGLEAAITDWMKNHRVNWLNNKLKEDKDIIEKSQQPLPEKV